ncbi:MAG: DnaB-like helicase C-terminal domain-containing protein [Ignavibacteriaceae bacterium]
MDKIEIKTELEMQILACMVKESENIPFIYQRIKPDDFTEANKELFEALAEIDLSKVNDSNLLILKLSDMKLKHWTLQSIFNLEKKDVSFDSLIYNQVLHRFSDIVFSLKVESILKIKLEYAKENINGLDLLSDLVDECNIEIVKVQNFKEETSYSVKAVIDEIEAEMSNKKITSYTTKNIPSFNSSTGGIKPTNLIGIAGSYKSGKTTFGLNLILDFVKQGTPCGFFSLELSESELNRKILAMLSEIQYEKLREPKKLSEPERKTLIKLYNESLSQKKDFPLYISDKRLTELEIKNKAKYWKDRHGIKIIAVDYIGYIQSNKRFETRERELTYYSEFMKGLAKELELTVIALAQLNRNGKQNPGTENLAESIALARDCDFLFTIFNPIEIGMKNNNGFNFQENHFVVKLDTSRHTKNKSSFILSLSDNGNFTEIATEYDNSFMNKKGGSLLPPELAKYVREEEIF